MWLNIIQIPELSDIPKWISENPENFEKIIGVYRNILRDVIDISDEEIEDILRAREMMREEDISLHSASSLNSSDFLQQVKTKRGFLKEDCIGALDFESELSKNALMNLQKMLEAGSEIAQNMNEKPVDGDPVWDQVIWGHTQANKDINPEVMIHFLLSHYLCQYMNLCLGEEYSLETKDDFINILTDMILLKYQNDDIFRIWSTKKEDGGLGWMDLKQAEVYKNL